MTTGEWPRVEIRLAATAATGGGMDTTRNALNAAATGSTPRPLNPKNMSVPLVPFVSNREEKN